MIEFEKPNIECLEIDETNNYAKFVCEPLERGYGVTIGNSLRRILLSSLPGCAITSVKIEGVLHEFSTIPNVVEDVPEVIVNLKNVRLKFDGNEEKTLRINFKGEGEVTAADIESDGTVEVLNPDLHIATVSEGGNLVMELTADRGRGYNSSEKNKKPNQDISVLPIDSIYTPVKKVNYHVENTRVGQMVDYDKLTIEVWTDGSLKAHEALSLAAKVMTGHLELFIDLSETTKNTQVMVEKEESKKEKVLEMSIEELELSVRSYNCLKRANISTVEDLLVYGKVETTLPRAKEVKSIVDSLISLAIKEKDNFEEVDVKVVKAKLDSKGNKVTELVKSKNGKEFLKVVKEETTEKRQKDMPSRLNARRKIMRKVNKVKDAEGNNIDVPAKLFNEIAPKYAGKNVGGYTRIVKAGPRRGDSAEVAILQLV